MQLPSGNCNSRTSAACDLRGITAPDLGHVVGQRKLLTYTQRVLLTDYRPLCCHSSFFFAACTGVSPRTGEEVKRPRARDGADPRHGLPLLTPGLVVASLQTNVACTGATIIYVGTSLLCTSICGMGTGRGIDPSTGAYTWMRHAVAYFLWSV